MKGWITGQQVEIKGYTGGEAALKYTSGGKAVTNFSVGTGSKEKGTSTWFDCAVWGENPDKGGAADLINRSGLAVRVIGYLATRMNKGKMYLKVSVKKLWVEAAGELVQVNVPEDERAAKPGGNGHKPGDLLPTGVGSDTPFE